MVVQEFDAQALFNLAIAARTIPDARSVPDTHWLHGDDLCDCTFQRIGEWTNPYLGETLRVRWCCIWAELYKQFPQFVQEIPASYDANRHEWVTEPREWDSPEMDMPLYLWYRQQARKSGKPLAEVRRTAKKEDRPKAKPNRIEVEVSDEVVNQARLARLRLTGWL